MALDFIEQVLAEIDSAARPLWPHELQLLLRTAAAKEELTLEEQAVFEREAAPWELFGSRQKLGSWGIFFGPSLEGQQEDGTPVTVPRRSILDEAAVRCWEKRLITVQHPVLRARYADAIWEVSKLLATPGPKPVSFARTAIDAYRAGACDQLTHHSYFDLDRALGLSIEVNDAERINACCEDLLALAEGAEQSAIGDWVAAARSFLPHRKVAEAYLLRALAGLEARLSAASTEGNFYAADTASELLVELHERNGSKDEMKRVLSMFGDTVLRGTRTVAPMVAIHWLENAAARLESKNLYAEAEALRLEVEKRAPDALSSMASFQTELKIPADELERELDRITDVTNPIRAVVRLAYALIPNRASLEAGAREIAEASPLLNLISQSLIGSDGLQRASVGPIEKDLEGRTMVHSVHHLMLNAEFFWVGYARIKERFPNFAISEVAEFCKHSELVTPEMHKDIEDALIAFDQRKHKEAVQSFITQLEPMLRGLLKLLEIPQHKGVRRHHGLTEAKNINDVLCDPRVEEALDENLHFFIRAVYIDKRALNLRHEYAHRGLQPHGYNQVIASLAVITLIALGSMGWHAAYMSKDDETDRALGDSVNKSK